MNATGLIICVCGGIAYFVITSIKWHRYRDDVMRFLSRSEGDEPNFEAITEKLSGINNEQRKFQFAAERYANVTFRGQCILFVYGSAGSIRGGRQVSWHIENTLFAIGDLKTTKWMENNSDVFRPAYIGSPTSVFFVDVSKLGG